MKIVYLKPFKRLRSFAVQKLQFISKVKNQGRRVQFIVSTLKLGLRKSFAFSLVEMLMALLVASLLLAALAPVMTKRMTDNEVKIISEAANYDKDSVITIFTDASEQKEFNIPTDASRITLTAVGAGGAGGNALYGNKEFTTSGTFTIPNDVNKIRVFMVGAGGGGASGGMGNGMAYANVPAIGAVETTLTNAGTYTLSDVVTIPNTYTAPVLNSYCDKFSALKKWVMKSNTSTQINPGAKISKIDGSAIVTFNKFTACGGGGGGGYTSGGIGASGGGSGGYVTNQTLAASAAASGIKFIVGAGGSGALQASYGQGGPGGGTGGAEGGGRGVPQGGQNGTNGSGGRGGYRTYSDMSGAHGFSGFGGGGGGGTAILSDTSAIAEIGGGGGGAGGTWGRSDGTISSSFISGAGGGGGGRGAGGGGGSLRLQMVNVGCQGRSGTTGGNNGSRGLCGFAPDDGGRYPEQQGGAGYDGGGGGGGGAYLDTPSTEGRTCTVANGSTTSRGGGGGGGGFTSRTYPDVSHAFGGGGGGGKGGRGGTGGPGGGIGGSISTIFGSSNCNGGDSGVDGKPGAMRVWYSIAGVTNGLQCAYSTQSNGGGGGGAGQVWMGEINVTPGQTFNLNIGHGGSAQNIGGENGIDGTPTSIVVNGNTYSVSGGKGGKFENDNTYIANSGGLGGGIKTTNYSSSAIYKDWLKLNEKGITLTGGNNGGQGYLKTDSESSAGGNGGSALKMDGTYAAGGVGGAAVTGGANSTNYGTGGGGGGAGTDGTFGNGGRGANGYIYIEWGGTNGGGGTNGEIVQRILTNFDMNDRKMLINIGKGGSNSSGDGNGGNTTISVKSGGKNVVVTARGGIKGNIGTSDANTHGAEMIFPSDYNNLYKDFVQNNLNIINGQKGINDYGGMGGYLACIYYSKDKDGNRVCNTSVDSNDGVEETAGPTRPGCGGSAIPSPLYEAICNAKSTSVSADGGNGTFGGGGGGGAVLNRMGGKGGNGGNGFVILEYKSVQ